MSSSLSEEQPLTALVPSGNSAFTCLMIYCLCSARFLVSKLLSLGANRSDVLRVRTPVGEYTIFGIVAMRAAANESFDAANLTLLRRVASDCGISVLRQLLLDATSSRWAPLEIYLKRASLWLKPIADALIPDFEDADDESHFFKETLNVNLVKLALQKCKESGHRRFLVFIHEFLCGEVLRELYEEVLEEDSLEEDSLESGFLEAHSLQCDILREIAADVLNEDDDGDESDVAIVPLNDGTLMVVFEDESSDGYLTEDTGDTVASQGSDASSQTGND